MADYYVIYQGTTYEVADFAAGISKAQELGPDAVFYVEAPTSTAGHTYAQGVKTVFLGGNGTDAKKYIFGGSNGVNQPASTNVTLGAGTYNYGDEVTITVETNEDWAFQNWTENGTVVSTEKTFTFTATTDRNFVANLLYTEGVGEQTGNNLVLYPNPVNDKLTVEAHEALGTVEIYNLMGALVYSQKNCASKVEINTSDLQSGIYFIRMTNDRMSETRRFVKE